MKSFLGLNKLSIKHLKQNIKRLSIIDKKNLKFSELKDITNFTTFLYYNYKKSLTLVIRNDEFIGNTLQSPRLRYIYKGVKSDFNWEYIHSVNTFIASKYVINEPFSIKHLSFYTIFFIKLIHNHLDLYSDEGRELIDINNGIFGIYDSYTDKVQSKHGLFFSYSLGLFILYRVIDNNNYIYGKLFNDVYVDEEYLYYNNKKCNIPKTFRNIKGKYFGIKKRSIMKQVNTNGIKIHNNILKNNNSHTIQLSEYERMCNVFNNSSLFFIDINKTITDKSFVQLYSFIIKTFPILAVLKTGYRIHPETFEENDYNLQLILIHVNKTGKTKIGIQLNQSVIQYLSIIIYKINSFINNPSKIKRENIILSSRVDICIHIISELSFISSMINRYWRMISIWSKRPYIHNLEESYIQIEYRFTNKEVLKFNNCSIYPYYKYLAILLIRSIASSMNNHFIFLHDNSDLDVIPIDKDMTIDSIEHFIEISKKARHSKSLFASFLSNTFVENFKSLPIILINIMDTSDTSINKIYGNVYKNNVPMIINIMHANNKNLLINITYKKKHRDIIAIFNELVK